MKRFRMVVPAIAIALALLPSSASAASYSESVLGAETGVPTSCGEGSLSSFAGIASGTIDGVFQIAVCHTNLGANGSIILGGTFVVSNGVTTASGVFSPGGTVSAPTTFHAGSLCIQKYSVSGGLQPTVGVTPTGNFMGKLVHYGSGTACNVFFATISGTAMFAT